MERIKVNFNMGGSIVRQGEINQFIPEFSKHHDVLDEEMNNGKPFITIYNDYGEPITYNKNSIFWICVQIED